MHRVDRFCVREKQRLAWSLCNVHCQIYSHTRAIASERKPTGCLLLQVIVQVMKHFCVHTRSQPQGHSRSQPQGHSNSPQAHSKHALQLCFGIAGVAHKVRTGQVPIIAKLVAGVFCLITCAPRGCSLFLLRSMIEHTTWLQQAAVQQGRYHPLVVNAWSTHDNNIHCLINTPLGWSTVGENSAQRWGTPGGHCGHQFAAHDSHPRTHVPTRMHYTQSSSQTPAPTLAPCNRELHPIDRWGQTHARAAMPQWHRPAAHWWVIAGEARVVFLAAGIAWT